MPSNMISILGVSALWDLVLGNYTPIEYIQSSGTQYIDTGIYPSGKIRMVAHIETTANNGGYSAFSGVIYPDFGTSVWQVIYPYNGVNINVSAEPLIFDIPYISEQTFDINQVAKTVTLNGQTKYFTNTPPAMPAGHANIPLCKYQNEIYPSPTQNGWYGKVYSVTIYDNDVLVRDFIPVRVGNVGYLYDKVSEKFFANQGTGDFVLGPDL